MRLYSTPESEAAGEITWLSILETVIAVAIYVAIWWYTGSLLHLAVAAIAAPLMLLRTEESTALAWNWFRRSYDPAANKASIPFKEIRRVLSKRQLVLLLAIGLLLIIVPFFMSLWAACLAIPVRLLAILVTFVRHPIKSIQAIPRNWNKIVLCLDVLTSPEVIPGANQSRDYEFLSVSYVNRLRVELSAGSQTSVTAFLVALVTLPILILGVLPSLLLRWSIKGTSLIYSPLIYFARISFPEGDLSLSERLKELLTDPFIKLLRIYAGFTLLMFAGKILLHVNWTTLQEWWNSITIFELFNVYIAPNEIPMWQVATAINAVITLGLFFFAYKAISRLDTGVWNDVVVERGVGWVLFGRGGMLTIYTVACLLYITVTEANLLEYWNRIEWGPWFPWG